MLLFYEASFANDQNPELSKALTPQSFLLHKIEVKNQNNGEQTYIFNGTDSYMELNERFDTTFSFCAWIKPSDLLKKNMAIVGIPGAFWLRTTTMRELQFTQPGFRDDNTEGLLLSADNWVFVTFVIDFPSTKIYLNAKLVGEFQWGGEKQEWKNQVFIGKDNWREGFHGSMKHVQIFKNVLSESTVKELYKNKPYVRSITDGIVLYHSFNAPKKFFITETVSEETFHVNFLKDSLRGSIGDFNGKDSYINFGELPIDNAITIAAWVKQNTLNRDYGAVAALGHAYAFRITTGGALLFTIPQIADLTDNNARITLGKWNHIAVTFKEQQGVTFYLNGEKTNSFAQENFQLAPKELQVGTNLWNDFYKGQMDDLIVWNKVLSDSEMKAVFKRESSFWETEIKVKKLNRTLVSIFIVVLVTLGSIIYLRNRKKQKEKELSLVPTLDPFKEKIEEIVFQNISDSKFSVNEFAKAMNMSKTKLYNEIKTKVHKSPKEYIRELRIMEAARLLKETDITITEVIFETGFESRAYFNKCFKEIYNVTPSEYRKKLLQSSHI